MNRRGGFTLIELMIVVIILAALAGMVLPRLLNRADTAKSYIAEADIASITTALNLYKLDNGSYPSSSEGGLKALLQPPKSARNGKEPYLDKVALDPWKRPYKYKYPGSHNPIGFDLWSTGVDIGNAEDDITNWGK